ncbi:unnamed protein product [Penicillium salamii]|nr:unnamed protein product [Penicillium salamii]
MSYGLKVWTSPDEAEFDIVFVHGLAGHREQTWTKNEPVTGKQILWPRDLLASEIRPSRIMGFGYDSAIVHRDRAQVTQGSLLTFARDLCTSLKTKRSDTGTSECPILLVAHSLGGLVCAQAVVLGDRNAIGDNVEVVSSSVKGIIFLGTPFGGSDKTKWADLVRGILNIMRQTDQTTLKSLAEDSDELKALETAFGEVMRKRSRGPNKIECVFFYEELDTHRLRIVKEGSASMPGIGETIPLRSDHINICKFATKDEPQYQRVRDKIRQLLSDDGNTPRDQVSCVLFWFFFSP